jgi:hypothetical protein
MLKNVNFFIFIILLALEFVELFRENNKLRTLDTSNFRVDRAFFATIARTITFLGLIIINLISILQYLTNKKVTT